MNIKQAVAMFLNQSDEVKDLTGDRIFPRRAMRGVKYPYVTIRKLGGDIFNDLPGEDSCTESMIDIAVYSRSSDTEVEDILEAIRQRLSSYRGMMADLWCEGCTLERGAIDTVQRPEDGSDSWLFASSVDYRITHSQPQLSHLGDS